MKMNNLEEKIGDALEDILTTLDGIEHREEKKKLLMALIVTIYEEAYNNANPLPIIYSERLN